MAIGNLALANDAYQRFATSDLSLEGEGDNDLEGEGDEEGRGADQQELPRLKHPGRRSQLWNETQVHFGMQSADTVLGELVGGYFRA